MGIFDSFFKKESNNESVLATEGLGFSINDKGYEILLLNNDLSENDRVILDDLAKRRNEIVMYCDEMIENLKRSNPEGDNSLRDSLMHPFIIRKDVSLNIIEMIKNKIAGVNLLTSGESIENSLEKIARLNKEINGLNENQAVSRDKLLLERDKEICVVGEMKYGLGKEENSKTI